MINWPPETGRREAEGEGGGQGLVERGGVSGGGVGLACGGPARPLLTQALGNALINFKSSTSPVSGPHWKQMLSREGGGRRGEWRREEG